MNCEEAKFLLPLYVSGELGAKEMAEFELHVQGCAACRRESREIRVYDDLLRDAFAEQAVDAGTLRARVRRQIVLSGSGPWTLFRRPRVYQLAAATAAFVLLTGVVLYFSAHLTTSTVYAAAVKDHVHEVVSRLPLDGWRETPGEIEDFVQSQLGDTELIHKLVLADYRLARARRCDFSGKPNLHLVYKNDAGEISVYVRRKGADLPDPAVETVNGCGLHAASEGGYEIAGFESERYTVLIVSALPRQESLRLIRMAAMSLT